MEQCKPASHHPAHDSCQSFARLYICFHFSTKAGDKHVPPVVGLIGVRYPVAFFIMKTFEHERVRFPFPVHVWHGL